VSSHARAETSPKHSHRTVLDEMEVQMQGLSSLTREHRMINELLGALQSHGEQLRSAGPVDVGDFARFATVFRELVDYRHHEKEEGILLPLLARNGFAWSTGILCEVRRDHRHLRYLIDVLCQASDKDVPQARERYRELAEAASAFVDFKRAHMLKEDSELLPLVQRRLDAEGMAQLGTQLQHFDEMSGRNERTAQIWQTAEELIQRYAASSGVVRAVTEGDAAYRAARYGT
jgi:hemerythrin-like domain-containing protein